MKPFLCFLGGCEFEYIIYELNSDPQKYFEFDYFHSFEHRGQTDPYTFLADDAKEVFETKPDVVILSQHDSMMSSITKIQLNRNPSRAQQDGHLKELINECELMIITLLPLNVPIVMQFFPWFRTNMLNRFKHTAPFYNEEQFTRKYVAAMEELSYQPSRRASLVSPGLSTVVQPRYEVGVPAATMLLERMRDPTMPARRQMLTSRLLSRHSLAPISTKG